MCGICAGTKGSSPGLVRIKHTREQHTVQLQRHVIRRDSALLGDLNRHLLQTLDVRNPVDERHEDRQPGFEDTVELAHALDDPRRLLRHEAHDRVGRQPRLLEVRRQGARDARGARRRRADAREEGVGGGCEGAGCHRREGGGLGEESPS